MNTILTIFRALRKTEAALETFERGCKNFIKKYTHPKEIDEGALNTVESEMKANEYGQSLTSINRGFGGVS
jgi:hypothetical protein